MSEHTKGFLIAVVVLLLTTFFAWAGWLSVTVVGIDKAVGVLGANLKKTEDRVERISMSLSKDSAIRTREILTRKIRTAVVVGDPIQNSGKIYRTISVIEGDEGKINLGQIEVHGVDPPPAVGMAILEAKNKNDTAQTLRELEDGIIRNEIDARKMPNFVDKNISLISSMEPHEIKKILERNAKWKAIKIVSFGSSPIDYDALVETVSQKSIYYTRFRD